MKIRIVALTMKWNKMSLSNKMSKTTTEIKNKLKSAQKYLKRKNNLIQITNAQQKTLTKIKVRTKMIQIQNMNKKYNNTK